MNNIAINIDATRLKGILQKDLPRAASKAITKSLNGTAFEVRKATQAKLPQWFHLTKASLPRQIIYQPATPSNPNTAVVGFSEKVHNAKLFEEGGTRKPHSSKAIAVPINVKRNKRGGITPANRPKKLLAKKNVFSAIIGGVHGVWRKEKRSGRLTLLFAYKRTTRYNKGKMNFRKVAAEVAAKVFPKKLEANLHDQLRKLRR